MASGSRRAFVLAVSLVPVAAACSRGASGTRAGAGSAAASSAANASPSTAAIASAPVAPPPRRPTVALTAVGDARTGSTVVLARRGARSVAYVADEDDRAVHAVDLDDGTDLGATPLASRPAQMVLTDDGKLLVALRDRAQVAALEATDALAEPLQAGATFDTATEPVALALTPAARGQDGVLLVASGRAGTLEGFTVATQARTFALPVGREPRAVLVTTDGKRAFVGHAAASELRVLDLTKTETTVLDLHRAAHSFCVDNEFGFPDDNRPMADPCTAFPARASRQIFALARDGAPGGKEHVYVPQTLADSGPVLTRTIGYGGGKETVPAQVFDVDAVVGTTVVDRHGADFSPTEVRGGANASCILPRAAVVDAKHHALYVACLGSDAVVEFDTATSPVTAFPRRRWSVPSGPTGLALDAERGALVVWSQFDRVVTSIPLATHVASPKDGSHPYTLAPPRIALSPVRENPMTDAVALGRRLFHAVGDRRISLDGRACASCHPDGRDDGLVWSSPDGPRQTITLAGRVGAGPYGWRGESATIAEHVRQTVVKLRGSGLGDPEVAALEAYVRALPAPPEAVPGDEARVARGRALFASPDTACATCHKGADGFADQDVHDVSSRAAADRFASFETPSLRGVGASAPYFHDGRYATLEELLEKCDGSEAGGAPGESRETQRAMAARMGSTAQLSPDDRAALASYLRTL